MAMHHTPAVDDVHVVRHRHASRADVFGTFEDSPDTQYMYRPGEILVATADAHVVRPLLDDSGATMEDEDATLELQKWCLPRVDGVRYQVSRCRSMSETVVPAVSANVVLGLGWHTGWGCASSPMPARALEIPEGQAGYGPGAGVRVGLIDTGVNDHHQWVNERSERRYGLDVEVASLTGNDTVDEAAGHGTFAAGLILRRAPGATVVVRGQVTGGGLIDDWVLARALLELGQTEGDERVDLIHLSLGGFTPDNIGLLATGRALRILSATNPDLVVVASAGNDGVDRPHYPAAYKGVVGVGALEGEKGAASFTNFGNWIDACTNGVNVVSTYFAGALVPPMAASLTPQPFDGWASWSGSSHAAAQVSGAIAARMEPANGSPRISARQAVFELMTAAGAGPRVPDLGVRIP